MIAPLRPAPMMTISAMLFLPQGPLLRPAAVVAPHRAGRYDIRTFECVNAVGASCDEMTISARGRTTNAAARPPRCRPASLAEASSELRLDRRLGVEVVGPADRHLRLAERGADVAELRRAERRQLRPGHVDLGAVVAGEVDRRIPRHAVAQAGAELARRDGRRYDVEGDVPSVDRIVVDLNPGPEREGRGGAPFGAEGDDMDIAPAEAGAARRAVWQPDVGRVGDRGHARIEDALVVEHQGEGRHGVPGDTGVHPARDVEAALIGEQALILRYVLHPGGRRAGEPDAERRRHLPLDAGVHTRSDGVVAAIVGQVGRVGGKRAERSEALDAELLEGENRSETKR